MWGSVKYLSQMYDGRHAVEVPSAEEYDALHRWQNRPHQPADDPSGESAHSPSERSSRLNQIGRLYSEEFRRRRTGRFGFAGARKG